MTRKYFNSESARQLARKYHVTATDVTTAQVGCNITIKNIKEYYQQKYDEIKESRITFEYLTDRYNNKQDILSIQKKFNSNAAKQLADKYCFYIDDIPSNSNIITTTNINFLYNVLYKISESENESENESE